MSFSPQEIASKKFSISAAEGYDATEVEAFLSELAREYRRALQSSATGESALEAVSKEAAEILRAAGEWAEKQLLAADEEARGIERRAVSDLNETPHESEVKEATAYEAAEGARRRAKAVIAEARSQSDALLEAAKRRVDQLLEKKEEQRARFSAKQQQLLEEIETVEKVTLRLRTDLSEAKKVPAGGDESIRVLVVSSDDRTLAPMAAALLRRALVLRGCSWAEVSSAGTKAESGDPPDEQIRSFLDARGIDISAHRSRSVDAGEVLRADLVIAMTQSERNQILQRVPEANAVLLKELQEVSVTYRRNGGPRERIRALVAQAVRGGDGYDLDAVGVWPRLYHQCLNEMLPGIDALASLLAGDSSDLRMERSIRPAQVTSDPTLFDWLRHYAALIGLLVFLGVTGASLYIVLGPRQYEASTLVIDTGREFTARQLALVSQATFRSPAVVGPTMSELGIDAPTQEFLEGSLDLRPVPDTNTLMVIGRSNSLDRAQAISEAATESFVTVSNSRTDLTNFVIFGRSQGAPIQQEIAPPVAVALGATIGFWLGIAIAVLHYGLKRPVLAFARALMVSRADRVTILDGKWSWLGILRPGPLRAAPRLAPAKFRQRNEDQGAREQPITWFGEGNGTRVIVANSSTRERELELARLTPIGKGMDHPPGHVQLVWLR
jgi:DivIVA domain-containing protein